MILIGKIINTHGLSGFIKIKPETDFPERFNPRKKFWIETAEGLKEFSIQKSFIQKNFFIVKLEEINGVDEAEKIVKKNIYIKESELKRLNKDEYYIHDLIGMKIFDDKGIEAGKIENVYQMPSNDIYEGITNDGKKFLIPALKIYIKEIDIKNKKLVLMTREGIID